MGHLDFTLSIRDDVISHVLHHLDSTPETPVSGYGRAAGIGGAGPRAMLACARQQPLSERVRMFPWLNGFAKLQMAMTGLAAESDLLTSQTLRRMQQADEDAAVADTNTPMGVVSP